MKCSLEKRLYQRKYRETHPVDCVEYGLYYYNKNKDHLLERQRGYDAKKKTLLLGQRNAAKLFLELPL